MKQFLIHKARHTAAALALALGTLLTACVNDYDDCPDPNGGGAGSDVVTFSFQMVSSNIAPSRAASRALDQGGHDETTSEWPAFEDKIVEDDFAFYIFAQTPDGEWRRIMSLTQPISKVKDAQITVNGVSGIWMVTAAIPKADLESTLGYKLTGKPDQTVRLRVAVIANANAGKEDAAATEKINYSYLNQPTFSQFIALAKNLVLFNLASIHSENQGDSKIDGIYKGAIPMYGMKEFSVSGQQLFYSNNQDPAWMGTVDMLRALAKYRVVDNIENRDPETGFPYILQASLFSATARAYVLPINAETFQGEQVDEPNTYYRDDTSVYSVKLGYYTDPDVHFGYLPEQTITSATPYVRITVALGKDDAGNLVTKDYDVPMKAYNNQTFDFGQYILRNHIYTLSVNAVNVDTELTLNIEVAPWTEAPFELDYTQTLIIPEYFKFFFSNQAGNVDKTNGLVYFKPWTTNSEGVDTWSPITCKFGIESPLGATWTAYLNTVEGEQNAFAFLDDDGNLQPHLTGTVKNEYVNFRVVTQNSEPEITNRARLQVYVRFADNTMEEAILTDEGATYKSYTLVQNPL